MIRRLLAVLRTRGEITDPVDDAYTTAHAALCAGCQDCTDNLFWSIVAPYTTPTTEE